MSTTRWPSILPAIALLAGCSGGDAPAPSAPVTQQRQVADFHQVELRGAAQLIINVGPATSLTAVGNQAALDKLTTEVMDGKLVIRHERGWSWLNGGGTLKLTLTTPALDDLQVNGAGDVSISGVKGDAFELELSGAADIEAKGETAKLAAQINGAGDIDLSQLIARDARVSVNGAGDLKVHATGALDATVNGVGSISYSGNPAPVKTAINGLGSIKPASPGSG
jgi:hypothetical protein